MASIIKRTYRATLPNGKTEVRECEHWTIQYRNAAGKICRVKGYKDKGATKQLAAKIELAQARGEEGMINPFKTHLATALHNHVKDYIGDLTAAGCNQKYVENNQHRLERLIDECGWTSLKTIDANSFIRWRDGAKKAPRNGTTKLAEGKLTASAETLNQYLEVARAFTNWCATTGRMPGVPIGNGKMIAPVLAGVTKVDGEKRRKRRALTDEQVTKLLTVAPTERAIVYRFGVTTGLRRAEIEDLQWGDLHLAATKPYIQLRAEATKAGRADQIPLPPLLADELRKLKPADATDGDHVFARVPSLKWWKADLKSAKIPYLDAQGRAVDFHAGTRKTLCTRMHNNKVPLAAAMRVMRHTDSRLTLVDYTDEDQLGIADVVDGLPELVKPAEKVQAVKAG